MRMFVEDGIKKDYRMGRNGDVIMLYENGAVAYRMSFLEAVEEMNKMYKTIEQCYSEIADKEEIIVELSKKDGICWVDFEANARFEDDERMIDIYLSDTTIDPDDDLYEVRKIENPVKY